MIWPYVLLAIAALAVVLYTERRGLATGPLHAVAKITASASFLAAAVSAGAFASFYGQTLFLALAWSFVGDVLLIPKDSRLAFMLGIAAFLLSHLGYVMVFRMRGVDMTAVLAAGLGLLIAAVFIWRWLSPHVRGGMRPAVIAYVAVITLMVAFAVGTTVLRPAPLPLLGALLFWLSDLTVARQRFVAPSFWNRVVGLPLYYGAQFLFVGLLGETAPA
jgi:uncharacterized membrane protein YhhN